VSRGAELWLSLNTHKQSLQCVQSLKQQGFQLWVTDLAPGAVPIHQIQRKLSKSGVVESVDKKVADENFHWVNEEDKIAVVFGNEMHGVSETFLKNADILHPPPTLR